MVTTFLSYGLAGGIVGILAGLFGVGGGLVIVPMLVYVFSLQNIPDEMTMHLALATSLASIMFTSISSFRSHHKRGAVHWDVVRKIVPGILAGSFLGSLIASKMSTEFLKIFFIIFLYFVATQMLMGKRPKPGREIPGPAGMFATGNGIGIISSLVGIGGGTLSVPFMLWCNINAHHAIGTSAAIGLPIAIAGAFGYVVNGWNVSALPPFSLGYVYLPALVGIAAVSVLTAPVGVRLAHSLPVDRLKRIFSLLLYVVATRMLIGIL